MRSETAYHGAMGEEFAAQATDSTYNAHTDRPAVLGLAGDVAGLEVLDLGCGGGHYAAELLARGAASVTGVDGSESLLAVARERLGPAVALHHHDLERPLDFLPEGAFDLAVLALVYHHVEARDHLLAEVRRVLRPGGTLLVSTSHPTGDWAHFGGSYFDEDRVSLPFGQGHALTFRRLTLETFIGELLAAGFLLEALVEPRAVEAGRRVDPRRHAKSHEKPMFLAVRLRRP
ncbi:class I SAM-dependent methyltransferase [Streptomyces sp. NPDC097619]|uniref:class I SAM-dependent methyltransferase n=1 Tax=Streptomyces sp. NPDC097619 TaxID=3157228 RepID=UPI00331C5FEE